MTKSTITRERLEWLSQISCRDDIEDIGGDEIRELASMALAAMDSEPVRNPVLAYADIYRDMAKQGFESVPIWSVITDLERNIAPLYRHAQQPVVSAELLHTAASAIEDLLTTKDRMGVYVCFDLPFRLRSAANAQPAPVVQCVPLGDSPYDVPYSMPSNLRELIAEEIGILFSDDDAQGVWIACRRAAMLAAAKQEVK